LEDNYKGKPLYIKKSQKHIKHLFFDDNLLKNSVVNIYELDMNEQIDHNEYKAAFNVDVIQALCDENYFIDKIKGIL
jgi:hypothetical protein